MAAAGSPVIDPRRDFWRERWPWLLAVVLVIALRDVQLWTAPRFWAEEGFYYYQRVRGGSWFEALFACPQGYYSLPCRLGALLACLVPVEHAPLMTTALALVFQSTPGLLVVRLAHRSAWSGPATSVAVAAVVLAPPLHETWLTSTNSAFHLVLAGAITLVFHERLALRRVSWAVLLVAGLCSGYAIALAPIAFATVALRPTRDQLVLLAIVCVAIGLEGVAWLTAGSTQVRGFGVPPDVAMASFTTKCVVLPLAGNAAADRAGAFFIVCFAEGIFWWWLPALLAPLVVGWWVILRSRDRDAFAAFASGHVLAATGLLFGLGPKLLMVSGEPFGRYFQPATSLHALALFLVAQSNPVKWQRAVAALFVFATIVQGSVQYFELPPLFYEGPDWRAEVAAWRQDPSRPLAIWPGEERWMIRLTPR